MNIFLFKEQANNRGYYCEISTNCNYDELAPSQLIVHYTGDHRWQVAVEEASSIFFDYFTKANKGKLEIDIEVMKWRPVDTNDTVVKYATIKALSQQLKINLPDVSFDKTSGAFTFSKKANNTV